MLNNHRTVQGITMTIVFEGSALNRDEKIGGNIPSIKKLMRSTGKGETTFSYISRESIRHHLFHTLNTLYPDVWKLTPLSSSSGAKTVLRFDLSEASIIGFAELDAFGYMYTMTGNNSVTRKAAVGITKAVALEPWSGDMQFNANHGLVQRKNRERDEEEKEVTPNPVNKEEHLSYYKGSFTIDTARLGTDEWRVVKMPEYDKDEKVLKLTLSEESKKGAESGDSSSDTTATEEEKPNKSTSKSKKKAKELEVCSIRNCEPAENGEYIVRDAEDNESGRISSEKNRVIFRVSEKEKNRRICQIFSAVRNGLRFHTSGENWGIVPKFIIAAGLRLPVPLFQSYVELKGFDSRILDNEYLLKQDGKPVLYLQDHMNLTTPDISAISEWQEFLALLGIEGE